jgi:2-(1,2-epoxy-1,2-dihydrophenyl)acetyl-CoA isomerase
LTYEFIQFSQKNGVGVVTFNRPIVFNSMNHPMRFEIQNALDFCQKTPEIRAVLLTGNGKAFCAGQDLAEIVAPDGPNLSDILSEGFNPIVERIRLLEKPVVAAVNGVAAGAGANLALACDIVLGAESASFIQAFSKIGLIPDSAGTFFLPRLVGFQKASALMMLGDKITATEAERMGMIYKVLPDENFLEAAQNIAETLAKLPTRGLWLTKKALNLSAKNDVQQQLAVENELQAEASRTADYAEGVRAFLEKRKPNFNGK